MFEARDRDRRQRIIAAVNDAAVLSKPIVLRGTVILGNICAGGAKWRALGNTVIA
jgi:hypothetical protein